MGTWCFSSVHTHDLFCFRSCWTTSYNSLQNEVTWVGVPTKTTHFFVGDHNVCSFWHILPSNSFNWPSCVSNWAKQPVISYKQNSSFLDFLLNGFTNDTFDPSTGHVSEWNRIFAPFSEYWGINYRRCIPNLTRLLIAVIWLHQTTGTAKAKTTTSPWRIWSSGTAVRLFFFKVDS